MATCASGSSRRLGRFSIHTQRPGGDGRRDRRPAPGAPLTLAQDLPDGVIQFLLPSRYCQSDQLGKLALEIAGTATPGYDQAEAIRAWIYANVEYAYGTSDASTAALDTAERRVGVCRDFAHLGMALCRALNIPARMVVGYLYRLDPMDLHAWFEAFVGGRWYTFDATQAAPRGGRIVIAYGRDAADVALTTQFGPATLEQMRVWVDRAGDTMTRRPVKVSHSTRRVSDTVRVYPCGHAKISIPVMALLVRDRDQSLLLLILRKIMHELVIGTSNPAKKQMIQSALRPLGIAVRAVDDYGIALDVEEDGATAQANARKKALTYAQALGRPVLSMDNTLYLRDLARRRAAGRPHRPYRRQAAPRHRRGVISPLRRADRAPGRRGSMATGSSGSALRPKMNASSRPRSSRPERL